MKPLFAAIYTKFTGSALATALTGGLHNTQAPLGTSFPFGVMTLVSDVHEWDFVDEYESSRIQFDIYSDAASPGAALDAAALLWTLFDDCALTISGYTHLYMQRSFAQFLRDDDTVWHYIVEYNILAEKT